jgi:2-polyprenyl-6-methoxyphenol hydroxylase-like FAD-dependent oxidoreductase
MYDIIVVGARVAGASTAMLLARRGLKVLCVDKAKFPSDTLSTHQIQVPGVARLKRWGLLDALVAANTPPTRDVLYDTGTVVLEGRFPPFEGADALYGPRRTVLDKILVDAARASGAEIAEDVIVKELLSTNGRITGVRGCAAGGRSLCETAPLVIGADGKQSLVARTVGAGTYYEKPLLSAAYYAYWDGLRPYRGELYERHRRVIGVWPTNDGLTVTIIGLPMADFAEFRSDVAGNVAKAFQLIPDLSDRIRGARQVGRFVGTGNLPNRFRKPYGPGWALVGDAGLVMDPITGLGIGHAFRDAELVADAVEDGFGGKRKLEHAMRAYEKERNRQTLPMYRLTVEQAAMGPRKRELEVLFQSLRGNRAEIDQLFGALSGAVPLRDYRSPLHLLKVLGLRGIAAILHDKIMGRAFAQRPAVTL